MISWHLKVLKGAISPSFLILAVILDTHHHVHFKCCSIPFYITDCRYVWSSFAKRRLDYPHHVRPRFIHVSSISIEVTVYPFPVMILPISIPGRLKYEDSSALSYDDNSRVNRAVPNTQWTQSVRRSEAIDFRWWCRMMKLKSKEKWKSEGR
jgi:hypothetical protein